MIFVASCLKVVATYFPWADKLVELKTICHCGRKANMVIRQDETGKAIADGDQVVIGGNDRYVSVCRKHYKEALGR